ncbi:uncharacterized protein LOC142343183 isoform X3 [Convolutriloba macropyga]|uniref:uncharacterized protein LOC142343183 isoform X3 n=1 Tax=Convolutriloba macropyga TaxID=536237 RepID=UPI003F520FF3
MGGYFSSPSNDVFDQPDAELFGDHFFIGGIKFSSEKIKLDQSQRDGRNDTRNIDARLDSRLLFGSKEDMMHLGKKAFPFSGPLPNGSEPLTTLRASVFVQRDSLRITKEVGGNIPQRNNRQPQLQPLLNQYNFSCRFDADVPGTATLYQRATEVFKDNKLSFQGEKIWEMKFEKSTNGMPIEFSSQKPIDHEGLVKELHHCMQNKTEPKETPLVLHLEAHESYHPGHSHAVYMKVDGSCNQYSAKIEKINQCNNGVVYLMQEIYNVAVDNPSDNGGGGGRGGNQADEDAISPVESSDRFSCAICFDRPMDSVLLPCRHLAFCSGCAVTMKLHNSQCPFCRKPYLVVLQIFFLKREMDCSPAELAAAATLAESLQQEARNNTWSNEAKPGAVPEGLVRLPIGIVVCPPSKNELPAGLGTSFAGIGGSGLGSLNGTISRSTISRPGYDTQLSTQSAASITLGGVSPSILQQSGEYGVVYGRGNTLINKFEPQSSIYEKDEHRNETIQRPPATITPGSRALPKVPIEEDSQLNTPDSYEVVDSGVKPFGFHKQQLHHQQHPGVAEVHGSNPSLDNTPIAMRKQRTPGGTAALSGRSGSGKTKTEMDLPPPPADMLTSTGSARQDSQEEEEERHRTLVGSKGHLSTSGGGDGSGTHRAQFSAGTAKRDTHRSDIYEMSPSPNPNTRGTSKSPLATTTPVQPPNVNKQVAEHKEQQRKQQSQQHMTPNIPESKLATAVTTTGGRDSPSARHQPLPQIPVQTKKQHHHPPPTSRSRQVADQIDAGGPPPLFRSGISLNTLPHDGKIKHGPTQQQSQSKLISSQKQQTTPSSKDVGSNLQNTLPSGDGTLNREHFELPLSNTTPPTNTSQSHQYHLQHQQPLRDSSLTKDKSSKALPDPIHRHQSPVNASVAPGTASNYVNLESLNSARGKAPKRPPRTAAQAAGQASYINNPPPVPARGPSMQSAQKLAASTGSGLDR